MRTDGGRCRRHSGVIRNDGEQGRRKRWRVVAGLQDGTDRTHLAMAVCIGIERVGDDTALRHKQQQP